MQIFIVMKSNSIWAFHEQNVSSTENDNIMNKHEIRSLSNSDLNVRIP